MKWEQAGRYETASYLCSSFHFTYKELQRQKAHSGAAQAKSNSLQATASFYAMVLSYKAHVPNWEYAPMTLVALLVSCWFHRPSRHCHRFVSVEYHYHSNVSFITTWPSMPGATRHQLNNASPTVPKAFHVILNKTQSRAIITATA